MSDEKSDAQMLAEVVANSDKCPKTFGRRVRAIRRAAELTQEECARKSEYSVSSWCNIEYEEFDPSKKYLKYREKVLSYTRGGGIPSDGIQRKFREAHARMTRIAGALGMSAEELVAPLVEQAAA